MTLATKSKREAKKAEPADARDPDSLRVAGGEVERASGDVKDDHEAENLLGEKERSDQPSVDIPNAVEPPVTDVPDTTIALEKNSQLVQIENVLAEDLEDIYKQLPPDIKKTFKIKGEAVSKEIQGMMERGKLIAKKILKLIRDWLRLAPNINKHFLEQESKIKTDQIMALAKEAPEPLA